MHSREWYERRLTGFGASDAPALVGLSRWRTARGVVEEKARRIIPDLDEPERLRFRLGKELEPVIARHVEELARERLGYSAEWRLRRSSRFYRSKAHPYMTTNVDGFFHDYLVEMKTDVHGYEAWGDEEAEDVAANVPPMYYAQVQHALEATGRPRALLFVLIGLSDRKMYEIPRDDGFVADLVEIEAPLWQAVIEARARLDADPDALIDDLLPPVDGSQASTEWLKKRYPADDGLILPATAEQEQEIETLRTLLRQAAAVDEMVDAQKNRLRLIIGDAAGLSSSLGTITNKRSGDSQVVDWQKVTQAYRTLIERAQEAEPGVFDVALHDFGFATEPLDVALDSLVDLHSATREGSRRFVVPRAWSKP
jgi:putative phage-type endonuclease